MQEELIIIPIVMGTLFIGLPWLIFHYVTKWKTAATITNEDEHLLEELHHMARRLDDRMETIERIMAADNPDWRQSALPASKAEQAPTLENFDELLKKERHPS
ncbi:MULTISPECIES: envelope stress response membrane protein PspB [unclassified Sphingorhabdus]|jgi:phage shock protein B|uniref:envelope stress response membrane protein PspB n=1 Tax=unclassified Sphingorhabdus TaxID=2614947 RepID=UPI000C1EE407|nr:MULTISPECIES: envelope stress response membrane protein PspB [unclassified Sphingorhabdus]ATW04798.1 envelope stress response membrane protein PspB [Sphingorhabdus sp. YGSMI21]VWX57071.1 Envelope stress response membrane protein PspB [Sphingorhabdus sp. 109]